ncbi:hypothetical protein [Pseudomonas sp. F(2018)]|uniref:hypothetical protein n=1 Tax=Pseudomonas sp. F(2018) TaxID=2502240 RepID=UPI0010F4678D|nr:hypothetical protein [Pseudomonas sp. F(2018)]
MDPNNPYAAPTVELIDAQAPQQLSGWSPGQLRVLGWLNLVYLVATLVVVGLAFVESLATMGDWLSVAATLLGSYLVLRLKAFLEARFDARGLDWPVWLSVVLSVALELAQLYWGDTALAEFSVPSFIYFGGLAVLGLVILWLGIVLLKVENAYPVLRTLAWLNVASGVLVASVILLVIGILPMLAAMVASALVFFHGAKELEGSQAA